MITVKILVDNKEIESFDLNDGNHKGDLISRQSVLAGIDKYIEKAQSTGTKDDFISFAELVVKALPSVKNKGEWIPVSERLPEKNMRCLVAIGQFNFTEIATYSDLMETIDHRIFYQGDYGRGNFKDITRYVKAWQPLPEPYKGESENKG